MRNKLLIAFLLVVVTMVMGTSCSPTNTITQTSTKTPVPEGSVLKYSDEWLKDELTENGITYTKFLVTATVQNVGDEGTFWVNAEIIGENVVLNDRTPLNTKVYLRKAEEKTLTFDFWAKSGQFQYRVWCTSTPGLGTLPTTTKFTTTTTTIIETWETYTNSTYGYSIEFPSTWHLTGEVGVLISGPGSIEISFDPRRTQVDPTWSISNHVDLALKVISQGLVCRVLSRTDSLWWQSKYEASLFTVLYQYDSNSSVYKLRCLYLIRNGYLFIVSGEAYESEYDLYSSMIDKIIQSFRFI